MRVFCSLVYCVLFLLPVWWRSCAALVHVFPQPACCVLNFLLYSWGSPSSKASFSIAPDPSRVLGTGLEVFPTPASVRGSSYRWNSREERRAAGSSGWALSGTIPTQAQSAPSSGAAFCFGCSARHVFLGTGLVDYPAPASAKGSRYRRQNPCEDYRPPTSAEGAGRRQYPCNEGRSAENPGWCLFGSILGRTPRLVSATRVPTFSTSCRSSAQAGSSLSLRV